MNISLLDIVNKLIAVVTAIQNNPQLLAAIMDIVNLFHPANGGTQFNATAEEAQQVDKLKEAFDNAPEVHQALKASGLVATGISLQDLFTKFLSLLPLIAQIIAMFGKASPATT